MAQSKDYGYFALLFLIAAFIWLRDTTWMTTSDDTLPILVALPLFFWLEWPWKLLPNEFSLHKVHLPLGVALLFTGFMLGLTLFMTLGWTALLWAWISERVVPETRKKLSRLLILPLMAFPWIALDAFQIGWWFRLSGAWATGQVFSAVGFNVMQEGTRILVNETPIHVDVSCAGLNALQSMLIAGSVLAYLMVGNRPTYWLNIPFLAVMAWLANTLRIMMLTSVAVGVSQEFAMGWFHETGGWIVLFLMFLLCWLIFSLQSKTGSQQA